MFHANAWATTFACPMAGTKMVMPGAKLDGVSVYELLEGEKVTITAAVPTVWQMLLTHMEANNLKLPHLKKVMIVKNQILTAAKKAALQERLGEFAVRRRGVVEWSPIQAIVDRYESAARTRGVKHRTVTCYVGCLRTVLRGAGVDVTTATAEVLTATTIEEYVRKAIAADGSDSGRRTVASTLRQARALFAKWTASEYDGLKLPDLQAFRQAGSIKVPSVRYMLPDPFLLAQTREEAAKLTGRLRVAYLLCYELALRAGEAAVVQWSWFRQGEDGGIVLHLVRRQEWSPKGRERSLPVHPDLWRMLQDLKGAGDYLIEAKNATERSDVVVRDLAAWMRGWGWKTGKAAHELRKIRGSEWYTRLGADVSQTWLGHMDVATTCRYYATLTKQPAPLAPG
jgi:integrase